MSLETQHKVRNDRQALINKILILLIVFGILVSSCNTLPQSETAQATITVYITVDQEEKQLNIPANATVQSALTQAGITLNPLDKVEPSTYQIATDQLQVKVTRVEEKYEVEENVLPFASQTVRNESLPEGQTRLIQPGENGVQQITYRIRYEDGEPVQRSIFKTVNVVEPKPEIVMVGVQSPFSPIAINGVIAYIANGNAWIMEGTTANRRPVITSGDLDGKVFSLSQDQTRLLYSRSADKNDEGIINSLWVIDITRNNAQPVNIQINNVVHFADWVPGDGYIIACSTAEARDTAPGWQANNDFIMVYLTGEGNYATQEVKVDSNAGGLYGWWGASFAVSPSGNKIAYSRPDGVGLVSFSEASMTPVVDILPYQTNSDWAWVSQISWTPDEQFLYVVNHEASSGLTSDEESPNFNVGVLSLNAKTIIDVVPQTGMFSYPVVSPDLGNGRILIAYLQAIFPEQSETSRYRLMMMDRDGSNRIQLFPVEGSLGMEPQEISWSPMKTTEDPVWLAFRYQGNLWLYDISNSQARQITGDGSVGNLDWK